MDKELQKYYETLLDLFAHEGWKLFVEDIQDNADFLNNILTIKDEQDFWYRRGQLEATGRLLSYESTIKDSYDDFLEEANA